MHSPLLDKWKDKEHTTKTNTTVFSYHHLFNSSPAIKKGKNEPRGMEAHAGTSMLLLVSRPEISITIRAFKIVREKKRRIYMFKEKNTAWDRHTYRDIQASWRHRLIRKWFHQLTFPRSCHHMINQSIKWSQQ